MARKKTSKSVKEVVLDEYNHRCAVCGTDRPQIHHIDEDPNNNDLMNLIPLCPNQHLNDQHNPTRQIPIPILQLFRKYKDPAILKPQFKPIHERMLYLYLPAGLSGCEVEEAQEDLCQMVTCLEMGAYYSRRIASVNPVGYPIGLVGPSPSDLEEAQQEACLHALRVIAENWEKVERLIVELLRYQEWR